MQEKLSACEAEKHKHEGKNEQSVNWLKIATGDWEKLVAENAQLELKYEHLKDLPIEFAYILLYKKTILLHHTI